MTRTRRAAVKTALIASLAMGIGVATTVGATSLPPDTEPAGSEAAGDSPTCPEMDVPETTVAAETTAAPATTEADAAATTVAATTEAAPEETAAPATLPDNVTELDSSAAISINPQPRESLPQGGEFRLSVSSLADNWNGNHPDGNEGSFTDVREPMGYFPYTFDAEGAATVNTDFALEIATTENPFTVTYTLNPEAVWHSGNPITVADYEAEWHALNGTNAEFQVVQTEGYDKIASVEQGADEFEVVVTFCEPYPDYEALFALGGPAESVADPETFNTGWVGPMNNDWFTGPFEVGLYDDAQGLVELVPSDTWWGEAPLLDKITYRVISPDATPQAFANVELDFFDIGPDPNGYALAYSTPGAEVRAAAGPSFRHLTLNSGPNGGLIQDQVVRQAIQRSLDRAAIGDSDLAGIPWAAQALGNHVYVENSEFYVDNSDPWGTYDPAAARALLEENGWVLGDDGVYAKDGEQRLVVRFSQLVGVPVSENEAQLTQAQLAEVGIEVEIVDVAVDDFSTTLSSGEYEMIAFSWLGTPFAERGVSQLYGNGSDSNYAYSDIPAIDPLIEELRVTLDPVARAAIANEIDVILWEYGHSVTLYQRPDLAATQAGLANWGAFGLMTPRPWADVGWM